MDPIVRRLLESNHLEPKDSNEVVYNIRCVDQEGTLNKILEAIKTLGSIGHSCQVVIDPNTEEEQSFYYDGDGSDRILDIEIVK